MLTLSKIHCRCMRSAECLIWTGACNASDLPEASDGAKRRGISLRREVYRLAVGEVPAGMEVIPTCNVAKCLQPKHIEAVTRKERMRRLSEAGRVSTPAFVAARTASSRAKSSFSLEKAAELRARAKTMKRGQLQALADEFGISRCMASKIICGKAWMPPPAPAPEVKPQRLPGCATRSRFEPPPWFKGEFSREWEYLRARPANASQIHQAA